MRPARASSRAEAVPPPSSHDRILQAAKQLFAAHGYENTSTVAIARQAGTSESQLMKHFGSKEGLLEAIFDAAWFELNARVRRALEGAPAPADKLRALSDLIMSGFERDPDLKLLMLLEGRRIRKEGHMVMVTRGFREFVAQVDAVLTELHAAGHLRPEAQPEAVRSALMGALEGLLRDQLLARRVNFPARYTAKELRTVFQLLLAAFTAAGAPG